jgi:hypothetical protein
VPDQSSATTRVHPYTQSERYEKRKQQSVFNMTSDLPLPQTLITLSGLPGCGKTTLARLLVQELHFPILTIDDVVDAFRPIYLTISDETVWQERLAQRARQFPDAPVATWSQVDVQRRYFQPWQPGQALFLDGLNSVEDNFVVAMAFITNPDVRLVGW